jgi:DivIVA domain-containing protein
MGLSADDIEGLEFSQARKGYDRAEVERFRARAAKRVRKLEHKLDAARNAAAEADSASAADDSVELTRHIGEILKLAGEQTQRATDEAESAAAAIIAAARAEAATATADADEARRVALEAIEAVRIRVAEAIEVELGLHDELESAAAAVRDDGADLSESNGTSADPLAQVVSDAVDRASTPPR